jgi:hypothetical protein
VNEHYDDPKHALIEDLAGSVVNESFLRQILLGKFEQVANQLVVAVPILILFEQVRHEVLVADNLDPSEAESGIGGGVDLMKFPCEDVVEGSHFVLMKIVLLAGGVADQVQEQFEESALMVNLSLLRERSVEDAQNGLKSVLQKDAGVVTRNQLV